MLIPTWRLAYAKRRIRADLDAAVRETRRLRIYFRTTCNFLPGCEVLYIVKDLEEL